MFLGPYRPYTGCPDFWLSPTYGGHHSRPRRDLLFIGVPVGLLWPRHFSLTSGFSGAGALPCPFPMAAPTVTSQMSVSHPVLGDYPADADPKNEPESL